MAARRCILTIVASVVSASFIVSYLRRQRKPEQPPVHRAVVRGVLISGSRRQHSMEQRAAPEDAAALEVR